MTYAQLDGEAAGVDVGSDGLVALETFQVSIPTFLVIKFTARIFSYH